MAAPRSLRQGITVSWKPSLPHRKTLLKKIKGAGRTPWSDDVPFDFSWSAAMLHDSLVFFILNIMGGHKMAYVNPQPVTLKNTTRGKQHSLSDAPLAFYVLFCFALLAPVLGTRPHAPVWPVMCSTKTQLVKRCHIRITISVQKRTNSINPIRSGNEPTRQ